MNAKLTPTEALLKVARTRPFAPAVRSGKVTWSYAALWQRVRLLATKIDQIEQSGRSIGLFMGLEVDYVAGAHAAWLSGRTVVVLSQKWSPAVLQAVLNRADVGLILYGDLAPTDAMSVPTACTHDFVARSPPTSCPPPPAYEAVECVPVICSVTPTSGSTGVPKSIVYPMRKSLDILTEESSTILKPRDGQWLRGGTTFLRPLFEIRRFMFNQTTLYLDPATSVAGQCDNFTAELENPSNKQLLRVHFTPSVFRAFVDYVKHKFGENKSWTRVYWMVIGGENLSTQDLVLAKGIFPEATLACNYACSEVGFAGISQHFVRPNDPVPEAITFNATQGCEDFVLLNDEMEIVTKDVGATGIIGLITTQSATHYLGNAEATAHMFRPWGGDRILLYTDDIGCVAKDGRVVINGRRSRNVKINGLFIDLDFVERSLIKGFGSDMSAHGVIAYKLVKSKGEKIIMFWSGQSTNMDVLKLARETLRVQLGNNLAMSVSVAREIEEMPYNASYKIDLAKLQTLADEDAPAADVQSVSQAVVPAVDRVSEVATAIAKEVARLSRSVEPVPTDVPLMLAGLNSITVVQLNFWLQSQFNWDDDMSRLFEEDVTARVLAKDIVGDVSDTASEANSEASTLVDEEPLSKMDEIAQNISREVMRLSRSSDPVPTDIPLMLAGLNSITVVQLHFWLQATYDYEEDMVRLFEEDVTAEVVARDIVGEVSRDEKLQQELATIMGAPRRVPIPLPEIVEPAVEIEVSEPEVEVATPAPKRGRVMPKSPLSIKVFQPMDTSFERSPAEVALPVTATPYTASKEAAASSPFDIGFAPFESWSGKKSGVASTVMYGLLALGLLGSPMSPSFRNANSFDALRSARAPGSAHTPVFSPWLDAVRFPGMETVQSPWIAAPQAHAFPQSPVCF